MIQAVANDRGSVLAGPVRRLLRRHVMLRRWSAAVQTAGRATAAWMGLIAAACIVDRRLQLGAQVRLAWLIVTTGAAAAMIGWRLWRVLAHRIDYVLAAQSLERSCDAFHEELVTLASQYTLSVDQRGAAALLAAIEESVSRRLADVRLLRTVSWRAAALWWMWVVVGLEFAAALWPVAYLGEQNLMSRALMPLARVAPVTTTRLVVIGLRNVVRGSPMTVVALVGADEQPVLHYASAAGGIGGWTETIMSAARAPRVFEVTLPSVQRSMRYYVTAGDATSDMHAVDVRAIPAVREFAIDYAYPPYTKLPDRSVANANGVITAPTASKATVTIHCTTDLTAAELIVGGTSVAMKGGRAEWSATVTVSAESRLALNLHGADGVLGHGPATMAMHVVADRPPQVSMAEPGADLELGPADHLTLRYRAGDDYGVVGVNLSATVLEGARKKLQQTWPVSGEDQGPSAAGAADVDLAGLNPSLGDLVELQWTVRDGAGQTASSETARLLVSARPVDLAARRRVVELRVADRLIGTASAALASADNLVSAATTRESTEQRAESARRELALTAESLRQAEPPMLRVIPTCGDAPDVAAMCARWLDDVETSWREIGSTGLTTGGSTGLTTGTTASAALQSSRVRAWRDRVAAVQRDMDAVLRGELADALLAERADLAAATTRPAVPSGDLADFVQKLQTEWRNGAAELGVNANAPNVTQLLTAIRDAESTILRSCAPVDFDQAAAQWSGDPSQIADGILPGRLKLASAAEAMRADADYVWAWDLQLAGSAAAVIESLGPTGTRGLYAIHFDGLQDERDADRSGASDVPATRKAADEARQIMAAWSLGRRAGPVAGRSTTQPTTSGNALADVGVYEMGYAGRAVSSGDWDAIAASANAAVAMGRFGWAGVLDEMTQRAWNATTRPAGGATGGDASGSVADLRQAGEWSSLAQAIDALQRRQIAIISAAQGGESSADLSRRQIELRDDIGRAMQRQSRQMASVAAADGAVARASAIAEMTALRRTIDQTIVNDAMIANVVNTVGWAIDGWMVQKTAQWPLDVANAMAGDAAGRIAAGAGDSALSRQWEVMQGLEWARRDAVRRSAWARLGAVSAAGGGAAAGPGDTVMTGWGAAAGESGRGGTRQLTRPRVPPPGRGATTRPADVADYQDAIQAYFDALGQNQVQR